jgi:pimeloyl-ACP methyl ester carboxylesterase
MADLTLADGRTLRVHEAGPADGSLTVFWQHGTPGTGEPPVPLLPASARLGIRWVGYDRPGYGGSTPLPGRNVAAAAADVAEIAAALGIERFAVLGSSGGGPHTLACAALLPDRVVGAVSVSGLAPFGAAGLDWYAGMAAGAAATLRAAVAGRDAYVEHARTSEFDPGVFTDTDVAALSGDWRWLGEIAGTAAASLRAGQVDDELAFTREWGFAPDDVRVPVLLVHGGADRFVPATHSRWLAERIGSAELRISQEDGHVSVLRHGEAALEWLAAR